MNTPNNRIEMTEEQLRGIIRDSVRQAVDEMLVRLGVEVDDPLEMQKDFQHLRDWRQTTDSMKAKALLAAVGLLATGMMAAAWMGIKSALGVR
jgi:hypothetical protein